jgi:rhomboid family GlyGly-CTERM serine protease
MFDLPTKSYQFLGPMIIVTLCLLLFITEPSSNQWLAYDRSLIQNGEWWRILSGNWLHTNANHLMLNLGGVILLWALHGDFYRTQSYLVTLLICCVGCSLGILLFSPQLIWYVGLSGALHGLFVWGAVLDIRHGLKTGWLLLIGIVAKLIWEQTQGASQQVINLIEAQVATEAHLYGAISGAIIVAIMVLLKHDQKLQNTRET